MDSVDYMEDLVVEFIADLVSCLDRSLSCGLTIVVSACPAHSLESSVNTSSCPHYARHRSTPSLPLIP
jgi:hypothetical protein